MFLGTMEVRFAWYTLMLLFCLSDLWPPGGDIQAIKSDIYDKFCQICVLSELRPPVGNIQAIKSDIYDKFCQICIQKQQARELKILLMSKIAEHTVLNIIFHAS